MRKFVIFSRVHATLQPALSVGWSVGRSVGHTLLFFMILFLWPHCSCPNSLVTSNMAPAYPHATSVAVYPALFLRRGLTWPLSSVSICIMNDIAPLSYDLLVNLDDASTKVDWKYLWQNSLSKHNGVVDQSIDGNRKNMDIILKCHTRPNYQN